jgi:hypothetical protein
LGSLHRLCAKLYIIRRGAKAGNAVVFPRVTLIHFFMLSFDGGSGHATTGLMADLDLWGRIAQGL